MDTELEDDALPGTPADYSTDEGALGDLTAKLRASLPQEELTTTKELAGSNQPVTKNETESQAAHQGSQVPTSGREGQADAGGAQAAAPPAPSANTVREIMQSLGLQTSHYSDDRAALNDLLTTAYQSQQSAQQLARQVQSLQNYVHQIQGQIASTPPKPTSPQAPSRPPYDPVFGDIHVIEGENGDKRYVSRSTGLPVSPDTVQRAVAYAQHRDEFLRTLYERPEEAMAPLVQRSVEQAMSQFTKLQTEQNAQLSYQREVEQATNYVVGTFGELLFEPGPSGPNLSRPTPLGYRYLQTLESLPPNISPQLKAEFASNKLAIEILRSQQGRGSSHTFPSPMNHPQQPPTPGEQQRQGYRRAAQRNPNVSSPAANGTLDDFFENPAVDLKTKLQRAMTGQK